MVKKVAIPVLNEVVAPCFEVARYFKLCEIREGKKTLTTTEECTGCEGYGRVRFLYRNKANTLICNGIKMFYRDILESSGVIVISDIAGSVDNALYDFLAGKLRVEAQRSEFADLSSEIPHDDLVCWARELFESHGYKISLKSDVAPYLIDLSAEINCPICSKLIRVAICCGAHTYRADYEIKEFHHSALTEYQAKVYIYPGAAEIRRTCQEYDIELIDPDSEEPYQGKRTANKIPVLRNPVPGHEKACLISGKNKHKE